jgi:hypothetical protein
MGFRPLNEQEQALIAGAAKKAAEAAAAKTMPSVVSPTPEVTKDEVTDTVAAEETSVVTPVKTPFKKKST